MEDWYVMDYAIFERNGPLTNESEGDVLYDVSYYTRLFHTIMLSRAHNTLVVCAFLYLLEILATASCDIHIPSKTLENGKTPSFDARFPIDGRNNLH